jgi:hypothetical protein
MFDWPLFRAGCLRLRKRQAPEKPFGPPHGGHDSSAWKCPAKATPRPPTESLLLSAVPRRKLADGWPAMSSVSSKDPNSQPLKARLRVRGDRLETLDGREVQIVEAGSNFFPCHRRRRAARSRRSCGATRAATQASWRLSFQARALALLANQIFGWSYPVSVDGDGLLYKVS